MTQTLPMVSVGDADDFAAPEPMEASTEAVQTGVVATSLKSGTSLKTSYSNVNAHVSTRHTHIALTSRQV